MVLHPSERLARNLERAGFSQVGFARFIRVNERQVRRWIAGDAPIPGSVEELLKAMIRNGEKYNEEG